MKSELSKTIDYCKGRLKSYQTALTRLDYVNFNPQEYNKINKKIGHYKLIINELSKIEATRRGDGKNEAR